MKSGRNFFPTDSLKNMRFSLETYVEKVGLIRFYFLAVWIDRLNRKIRIRPSQHTFRALDQTRF